LNVIGGPTNNPNTINSHRYSDIPLFLFTETGNAGSPTAVDDESYWKNAVGMIRVFTCTKDTLKVKFPES
jgi:hypothetical protein